MEQESHKRKLEETSHDPQTAPVQCANSCGFFGSPSTNNLCSKCYKDFLLRQTKIIVESNVVVEHGKGSDQSPEKPVKEELRDVRLAKAHEGESSQTPRANKCSFCRKRVGLTGFKCRCGHTFCSQHRYSDKHNCAFDYKTAGQDAIAKANPVVKADKVEKI